MLQYNFACLSITTLTTFQIEFPTSTSPVCVLCLFSNKDRCRVIRFFSHPPTSGTAELNLWILAKSLINVIERAKIIHSSKTTRAADAVAKLSYLISFRSGTRVLTTTPNGNELRKQQTGKRKLQHCSECGGAKWFPVSVSNCEVSNFWQHCSRRNWIKITSLMTCDPWKKLWICMKTDTSRI